MLPILKSNFQANLYLTEILTLELVPKPLLSRIVDLFTTLADNVSGSLDFTSTISLATWPTSITRLPLTLSSLKVGGSVLEFRTET